MWLERKSILDRDMLGHCDRQRGDDEWRWRVWATMMRESVMRSVVRERFLDNWKHGEEERDSRLPCTRENRRSWLREIYNLGLGLGLIFIFIVRTIMGRMSWWWMVRAGELGVCFVECGQDGHDHRWWVMVMVRMRMAWFLVLFFGCFLAWMRFVLRRRRESNGTQDEFLLLLFFVLFYSALRRMMRACPIGNSDANGQVLAFRESGHVAVLFYLGHADVAMKQAIMKNDSPVAWDGDAELDAGQRRD
jgi:hypothetical protein